MANTKKNFWYVLVLNDNGPVFVTDIDFKTKTAHWNKEEAPLELGQYRAEDLALGLMCNFHTAYPIKSRIEIESQPYFYNRGHFEWVWNETADNKDDSKEETE